MSDSLLKDFKKFIKNKGLKYSPKREEILREILEVDGHFDVESLYLRLKERKSKVSKTSIYRTIPLLIEGGYIQEVYKQEGHSHYEVTLNKQPHLHFICVKCKKVDEISDERLLRLVEDYQKEKKCRVLSHHLEIFGICSDCKEED